MMFPGPAETVAVRMQEKPTVAVAPVMTRTWIGCGAPSPRLPWMVELRTLDFTRASTLMCRIAMRFSRRRVLLKS